MENTVILIPDHIGSGRDGDCWTYCNKKIYKKRSIEDFFIFLLANSLAKPFFLANR